MLVGFFLIRFDVLLNAEKYEKKQKKKKKEDQEAVGVSCASWLFSRVQRLWLGNSLLAGVITCTDPGRVGGFAATH